MQKTVLFITVVVIGIVFLYVVKQAYLTAQSLPDVQQNTDTSIHVQQERVHVASDALVQYPIAPEFVDPGAFINVDSMSLAQARQNHKLVLVHFWTLGCINCKRTLGYINDWYDKYHNDGLEIIGIHTPEFAYEHKSENVRDAVQENSIVYPVFLDNEYKTWRAYENRYWPHRYLITPDGSIIFDYIGEGAYNETEQKIRDILY